MNYKIYNQEYLTDIEKYRLDEFKKLNPEKEVYVYCSTIDNFDCGFKIIATTDIPGFSSMFGKIDFANAINITDYDNR